MESVKLIKPIKLIIDGKAQEMKVINVDFDNLTALDLLEAEREAVSKGVVINTATELNKHYLLIVVSKATKLKVEELYSLSATDFSTLTVKAQNFLMGGL